jgi:hypothetical protein
MQHINESSSNNVLSYFHGNIQVTLSYGFLNWVISHVNLYKENIFIITEPLSTKR